jgi:hypothetical protein
MAKVNRMVDSRLAYATTLKSLKKVLPKACTLLAPFTNNEGLNMVKYIVNGKEYYSSIPPNFTFTPADINELRETILSKI